MSDSGEFGDLAPTTPLVRVKSSRNNHNNHSKPGPSSKPAQKRKGASPSEEPDDDSDIEEVRPEEAPSRPAARSQRAKQGAKEQPEATGASKANGNSGNAKGKGKAPSRAAKAVPAAAPAKRGRKRAQKQPSPEPMDVDVDVDEAEGAEGEDDEQRAPALARALNSALAAKAAPRGEKRAAKSADESYKDERLKQAEATINTLSKQLEELFQVRETEPEKLLKEKEAQYQAQIQAQERLIREMTAQLARKEPLMREGKTGILHLMTREAADEEKRQLEGDVQYWQQLAKDRQATIEVREKRITELEQLEQDLRYEVRVEAEKAKTLATKARNTPASNSRVRPVTDDPKHVRVVRFYEDLTNLLVTNVKLGTSKQTDTEEQVFDCVYTYNDEEGDIVSKSIHFSLRLCDELPEADQPQNDSGELVHMAHYTPHELDKEPEDFVQGLGFLSGSFSFQYGQLALFLRTLNRVIGEAMGKNEDEQAASDPDLISN